MNIYKNEDINKIRERVKLIVTEQFELDSEKVTDDASFTKDLKADSLDVVELILSLEEEFNIAISDDQAAELQTIKQAVEFISQSKQKEN